jgi:Protein of unknown function (DUF3223)
MAKRETIKILDKEFGSQAKLKEYTREILYKYNLNQELSSEDLKFMIALIQKRHPDADEKIGDGIERMWIQENTVSHGTHRGFRFERVDGSMDNFSYKACIEKPPSTASHFLMACRESVSSHVNIYREEAFQNTETLECPITGELITLKESYVAYSFPSFKKLTEQFKEAEKLIVSEEFFKAHGDGDFTMSFADENIRQKWITFWRENANLEIRSKSILGTKP